MSVALVVMAKAPVPGLAKTRLAPALGAAGAARLAAAFLTHTLNAGLAAACGPVTLCCAPNARHPAFAPWAGNAQLTLEDQAAGDLGERMAAALARGFERAHAVLLFGTDAPALDAAMLRRAAAALAAHRAVFIPTLDGGYVLVGLARPLRPRAWATLFRDMPWSTAEVMPQTRRRLADLGVAALELPALADVDEARDLVHLGTGWL